MATVNGDVTIRVGSEDPVTLQLLEDDGVTPLNQANGGLVNITLLTLRLKEEDTGTVKTFTGAKLTVTDVANSEIQLAQVAADFPSATRYEFYVSFTDSGGKAHAVPEDKNYIWRVTAKIGT